MARPAPGVAILWLPIRDVRAGDLIVFDQDDIRVEAIRVEGGHIVKLAGTVTRGIGHGTKGTWTYPASLPVEVHRG